MPPTYPPNATFTSRLKLPRPGLDDVADGPDAFNDLTDILDPLIAAYASGTTAARPATPPAGSFYWNTDTKTLEFYNGTAWGAASGTAPLVSSPVGEVGQVSQCRAGRQLALADFTALGLSAPRGLWNLSDLTDASGNGRALANKGAVTFGVGINGAAATAAQFTGSASQALYIADTGAADPLRISTGSWGCWFRTAKRGTLQFCLAKSGTASPNFGVMIYVAGGNTLTTQVSATGAEATVPITAGVSDVADDRWHFGVVTHDGTATRVYVDGTLEATGAAAGPVFASSGPLNIGGFGADAGAAAASPYYGRVDEAFITADVLTEDQVRSLYAARIVHTLGAQPKTVSLNVRRQRRGAALAPADFSTQPLRLHNFTAGSLADQGSNGTALTVAAGTPVSVAGADGTLGGGYSFNGAANLGASDAGLPSALAARSYGCWFKTATYAGGPGLMAWGTVSTGDARLLLGGTGLLSTYSNLDLITGPFAGDGQWHHAVVVEDNTLAPGVGDGVKRKLYLDGRVVGGSTVMNSIGGAGAQPRFRIGSYSEGTGLFTGQIDGAFVCGYAMTTDEVLRLYAKGAQTLAASPKNAGDHVEGYDSGSVLFIGDSLDAPHIVDLTLA
jgi:hypothetical protein